MRGRYPEAESLFRRALTIAKKVSVPEHPRVALVMNNLAEICRLSGRMPEAEALNRQVVVLLEKTLGPDTRNWPWL
jgi:Tetratricopeptide repeat